ncbi:multiheme c-type cytochrome [Nevskia sp.]|uniref:multiheme c-type cytochrome n=1 Tax=Nevskia sp. TaxID=1929292 RepID=UPI0025DBC2F2|nr:multiheme c-type cytochrome [Nevskia sp.]
MSRSRFAISIVRWLLAGWLLAGSAAAVIAADRHLGVASCAGSTCHGATRAFAGSPIRQDEYFIWQRQDRHARAYRSLETPLAGKIASRLALGKATSAKACTVCHAPAVEVRGERSQVEDGIDCESCHGAAERWIGSHVKGYASEQERLAAGLLPTWRAAERAQACSGCHVGDPAHPISHAMMAAGHPPLLFELNTFTSIEPPHWDVDADYIARKSAPDSADDWLHGQLATARAQLDNLASGRLRRGLFPELAFFDCNACHHPMTAKRASDARSGDAMQPGAPVLADTALVMLGHWLDVVDPALAQQWHRQWQTLHAATAAADPPTGPSSVAVQAQQMRELLDRRLKALAARGTLNPGELRRIISAIIDAASARHGGDFSHAEHTAMAVAVLATAWSDRRGPGLMAAVQPALDEVYQEVRDRDRFDPARYRASLKDLLSALEH